MKLQKKKGKQQIITHKTKDRGIRITLKPGDDTRVISSRSTCHTRRATVKQRERHLTLKSCWIYVNKYKKKPIKKTCSLYNTNGSQGIFTRISQHGNNVKIHYYIKEITHSLRVHILLSRKCESHEYCNENKLFNAD